MKEKLTIGEFAKLKNITTETLRHYDRIGLLKPIEVDTQTGYRYYSISQEEEIGTIIELKQLGMSIEEIKVYFNNRNLKQSINILKSKQNDLKDKIKELENLDESINEKIKHLENISNISNFDQVLVKEIGLRQIILTDIPLEDDIQLSYAFVSLSKTLDGIAPILASNRIGLLIPKVNLAERNAKPTKPEPMRLFHFLKTKDNNTDENILSIEKGLFASLYYKGDIWTVNYKLEKLMNFIKENDYQINGNALQIVHVDITVTDREEEGLYEIQIPIKKI